MNPAYTQRTRLLLGDAAMDRLADARVVLVGVGGVGGPCAEALCRSGLGRLTIIDGDTVEPSNLNRQPAADRLTLGRSKAEAMAERLRGVSDTLVDPVAVFLTPDNAARFVPEADCIVDAVDDVPAKAALALLARERGVHILACLGSGNRLDPARLTVTDIYRTAGDPLARRLRHELRRMGVGALPCVYSDEPPRVQPGQRQVGSYMPVTASAGLLAAAWVIERIISGS